jgi:hypothetical protein
VYPAGWFLKSYDREILRGKKKRDGKRILLNEAGKSRMGILLPRSCLSLKFKKQLYAAEAIF